MQTDDDELRSPAGVSIETIQTIRRRYSPEAFPLLEPEKCGIHMTISGVDIEIHPDPTQYGVLHIRVLDAALLAAKLLNRSDPNWRNRFETPIRSLLLGYRPGRWDLTTPTVVGNTLEITATNVTYSLEAM